tara:strand:- start:431 stop:1459 length:1029 start_codon:yes stop_codon:yes gene_type:complete
MGTKILQLVQTKEIELKDLAHKKIAIDAHMYLYQFLTTIRQRDGSLLKDSKGQVTSHLIGLFSRTAKMLEHNIKPCFVFDGKAPDLKTKERERRKSIKIKAKKDYDKAMADEDIESMKKYASMTTRLTGEMIQEAKELIQAFGLPVIQAPSEGEAQAAYMVSKGKVYALSTNDADALLYGVPRLIKNLSVSGKRKKPGQLAYVTVKPELIETPKVLQSLDINLDQLIIIAILVGTDYNYGGIKGIGPKKALKLVKENKDFETIFELVKWNETFKIPWKEIFDLIKNMPTTDDYELEWKPINIEKLKQLLCEKHDFTQERVDNTLNKLKSTLQSDQQGLGKFF